MPTADASLRIEGLTKRYGGLVAVDGLSLEVRPGEVFALLGPNGAGKSTTIGMIAGLVKPTAGRVAFGDGAGRAGARGRGAIGLCPQDICVWESLTCYEQLVLAARLYDVPGPEARRRATALLDAMGLADKGRKLAKTLSGGMKRRLNIVLALAHDPAILILDEPQAGLDPQSRILVREYLAGIARAKTVILTTHDMEEADKVADRVAIIDHGKLLCLDRPEALKAGGAKGDVVEIQLGAARADKAELELERRARAAHPGAALRGGLLSLLSPSATEDMGRLLALAAGLGLEVSDYRIRKKTLEDVFIALTGRGLRE